MDPHLLDEGRRVADELAADPPAAVVLTGREGFFSAGADLKVSDGHVTAVLPALSWNMLRLRPA